MHLVRKTKKFLSLIEISIWAVIFTWFLLFILNSIWAIDMFGNEKNIPKHISSFITNMKMIKANSIDTLKQVWWKSLFEKWDWWTSSQWFNKVISNCKFPEWDFKELETTFPNKFRIAAVWPNMAPEVDISTVDAIKVTLNRLSDFEINFVSWKKELFIDPTNPEFNSIWDTVYMIIVQHQKAWEAEFFFPKDWVNWWKIYANVWLLDSKWNRFDWITSKQTIRQILTKWAAANKDYNELTELSDKVVAKMKNNPACLK